MLKIKWLKDKNLPNKKHSESSATGLSADSLTKDDKDTHSLALWNIWAALGYPDQPPAACPEGFSSLKGPQMLLSWVPGVWLTFRFRHLNVYNVL